MAVSRTSILFPHEYLTFDFNIGGFIRVCQYKIINKLKKGFYPYLVNLVEMVEINHKVIHLNLHERLNTKPSHENQNPNRC